MGPRSRNSVALKDCNEFPKYQIAYFSSKRSITISSQSSPAPPGDNACKVNTSIKTSHRSKTLCMHGMSEHLAYVQAEERDVA